MTDEKIIKMLANVVNAREDIIQELRDMAMAKGIYASLTFAPPWMKDIWLVAAELLERDLQDRKKSSSK